MYLTVITSSSPNRLEPKPKPLYVARAGNKTFKVADF